MKIYKLAIMMSGGLDSFIAYYYAKAQGYSDEEMLCIWVDMGQPYREKELAALEKFPFSVTRIICDLLRPEFDNLPTPEDQVIPARNALLAYIGGFFASRVWISALDGEMHRDMVDKSAAFFRNSSHYWSWLLERKVVIETPFATMSKTDIVEWALQHDVTVDAMRETSTCYDEGEGHCGACSTCFKRWVAFANNDLQESYRVPPWTSDAAQMLIAAYEEAQEQEDWSHYSPKRINETWTALKKVEAR